MTGWYAKRRPDGSAGALIAMTLLALMLVAIVPVALLVSVILMMLGYLVVGLALLGGSVLGAAMAVALAGMSGRRRLRKLLSGSGFGDAPPNASAAEPEDSDYPNVVRLDRSDYTDVH